MVRENTDYTFLQPIYSKAQRETLFEMESVDMDKQEWSTLMDEVIERENLPGNTAQEPKKKVRIMGKFTFFPSSMQSWQAPVHKCSRARKRFFRLAYVVPTLVCADFEDSSIPEEKFYYFSPVPIKMLPKFRLCHSKYWDKKLQNKKSQFGEQEQKPSLTFGQLEQQLNSL